MTIYHKQYLMTAGPTPLPPAVSQVMAEPILYHRAPVFVELYAGVLERLRMVFQTRNEVLMFSSSGSGGMESAVANLVAPGDTPLVASCGKFGQRWAELCDAHGAKTIHFETEWGEKIDPDRVAEQLASAGGGVQVLFTTLSETSTGVVNDIRTLTQVAHDAGAIIVVDAVSGLGAVDIPMDEWGVDVVVSGSQKALMSPPGLGFAAVSERAMELAGAATGRGAHSYYFDLGQDAQGPGQGSARQPVHPGRHADPRPRRRARDDRGRDTAQGLRASRTARPRRPRGRQGHRASSCSAPRTRAPTSSPR